MSPPLAATVRDVSEGSALVDLFSLAKPRLSSLVLATTAGGMWLAGGMELSRALIALLATFGTVAAANTLNCWLERDIDRLMERTRNRPLPAGRLDPKIALGLGLALAMVSVPALALATNPLTGALGLVALLSYVLAYTPLKGKSWTAMLVGAVPGALPPLMGWTAAAGKIELPGLALFAILFLWQLPHFIAIALFRQDEYRNAGLTSLPLARGEEVARAHALVYLVLLVPVALLPYPLGVAGPLYLAVAAALSLGFLALGAAGFVRRAGRVWARRLFAASLVYLTVLFAALMVDRVGG